MDKRAILQKINEIIADLQEQSEGFANKAKPIDDIELEFFIANTKFLADQALILQRINGSATLIEPQEKTVIGILEDLPEMEDAEAETEIEPVAEFVYEPALPEEPEPLPEPVLEEIVEDPIEVVEVRMQQEIITETIVTEIEEVKPTLNDLMANRTSPNLAARFSQEPVKDLKTVINLNDKMLFVKDLFSGYSLAYQEAIDTLNRMEDFETADQFLQANYVVKYKWAEQSKTADRFYEILNRRFVK